MQCSVIGQVKSISDSIISKDPYMPIYEAITNSIQSIEESHRKDGEIRIRITRDKTIFNQSATQTPIKDFEIIDNGVGFNKANFLSFNESFTQYKSDKGGKGIGRFYWLKAFNKVRITSIFLEDDEKWKRQFIFELSDKKIPNKKDSSTVKIMTSIKLIGLKDKFRKMKKAYKKPNKIAQRILEHFLSYYLMGNNISIILEDDTLEEPIKLNDLYLKLKEEIKEENIKIEEKDFNLFHLKLRNTYNKMNKIVFCAHSRGVLNAKIDFSGLTSLEDGKGSTFYYACYVSSDFLNEKVDNSRQSFSIPIKNNEIINYSEDTISLETIKKEVKKSYEKYLKPIFDEIRKKKEEKIESFSQSNLHTIKTISKNKKKILKELNISSSNKDIHEIVYKYYGRSEYETRDKVNKILSTENHKKGLKEEIEVIFDTIEQSEKDELTHYMIYRKCIIDLFKKKTEVGEGGKIPYEKDVHNLLYPMKNDSFSINEKIINLWILDEHLVFHNYAASDLPINKIMKGTSSQKRPDIIVCQEVHGMTTKSVSIVELKRPYEDKDDPVTQLFKYVKKIKETHKFNNIPLRVNDDTLYYCYAICDIDEKIKELIMIHDLKKLPFRTGYFKYNSELKTILEIRAFDEIYNDVNRRHEAFFKRLKLN